MNHHDEVALQAAQQIEDIVWMSHAGGRAQFLARVQVVVVDAISRCMPKVSEIPQPAPFPAVQDEGAGIQGEDQRAQKEEVVAAATSAVAASAKHESADPRNSSCGPEVVTNAGPQTEQPYVTKRERALILLSTTDLSLAEIAEKLDSNANSIGVMINSARKAGDPRATCRAAPAAPAKGKQSLPETVPVPAAPPAAAPEPETETDETSLPILKLQEAGFRITGPKGKAWATDEMVYLATELLADGRMHSLDDMKRAGGWSSSGQVQRKLGFIGDKLEAIGVRLIHIQGQGCRIERVRS